MLRFFIRRLIVALLVAATVMTLAFAMTRLSGDLAISIAGPSATQADIETVRKAYGLDRPLVTQFFDWVGRASVGDLGESFFFKRRVSELIGERLPVTLTLGLTGLVIALVVSLLRSRRISRLPCSCAAAGRRLRRAVSSSIRCAAAERW